MATLRLPIVLFLSVLASSTAAADDCRRGFHSSDRIITNPGVDSAAYGDFNEDGRVDVAVMMLSDTRIIALNRGAVFEPLERELLPSPSFGTAFDAPIIAASDFNRDGHLDLLYRRYGFFGFSPGRGDGTFEQLVWSTVESSGDACRLVDYDHDGLLDFIDSDWASGGFTFIRARGDGTFAREGSLYLPSRTLQSIQTTAGDFDGDGRVDVVVFGTEVGNAKTTARFGWNEGAYSFKQSAVQVDVPHYLQPVDVDGDGAEELVGIVKGSMLVLRMRNRKVTREEFEISPSGMPFQDVLHFVTIDANADGVRDLAFSADGVVGVVWGSEPAVFRACSLYAVRGKGLALADIDHDGVIDFARTQGENGLATVDGRSLIAGSPNASRIYPARFTTDDLDFADVDRDGHGDLIAILGGWDALQAVVHFGDGRGAFDRVSKPYRLEYPYARAFAGDFDGDGFADLAVTSADGSAATSAVTFGGNDGFTTATLQIDSRVLPGVVWIDPGSPPALVALKGDEIQLVTVSSGRLATTSTIGRLPAGARLFVVGADRGVEPQLLVVDGDELRLLALRDGTWRESVVARNMPYVTQASAADFDRNGKADLLISDPSVALFYAQPDGTYELHQVGSADSMTVTDFDRDGWPDMVSVRRGFALVARNTGSDFEPYAATLAGGMRIVVEDMNEDGWSDLAIPSFNGAEVLISECGTARIRAEVVPRHPQPGTAVRIIVHALPADAFAVGLVTVTTNGTTLGSMVPGGAYDMATATFTSDPLAAGQHRFHIEYRDQYAGSSAIDLDVTAAASPTRRRAVHR